jgi:hypothetical protein
MFENVSVHVFPDEVIVPLVALKVTIAPVILTGKAVTVIDEGVPTDEVETWNNWDEALNVIYFPAIGSTSLVDPCRYTSLSLMILAIYVFLKLKH